MGELWDQGLSPEGKENTPEAKEFVRRMTEVSTKLASLEKESDGEAAKYGQDIVLLAAFNNAQKGFAAWIDGAEAKCKTGYGSPNSLEEATKMLDDCKRLHQPGDWQGQRRQDDAARGAGHALR